MFKDAKVGDYVELRNGDVAAIARVTKTMIYVRGVGYMRSTGVERGSWPRAIPIAKDLAEARRAEQQERHKVDVLIAKICEKLRKKPSAELQALLDHINGGLDDCPDKSAADADGDHRNSR